MITRTFAEVFFPGVFMSDSTVQEVTTRDLEAIEIPDGANGVRFYDRSEEVVDGELMIGKAKNHSPTIYFGEVWPRERIERELPGERTLILNARGNGWERMVRTRRGNWQPLRPDDVVLPAPPRRKA